jgi:transposase
MLAIYPAVPIYLHAEPIDMRKSFDGFFGIVKADLQRDLRDGGLFMFLNSRCNRIKLMYWDTDGIAIWMKRQKAEDTHFDIFTEVGIHRNFTGIADESS